MAGNVCTDKTRLPNIKGQEHIFVEDSNVLYTSYTLRWWVNLDRPSQQDGIMEQSNQQGGGNSYDRLEDSWLLYTRTGMDR